MLKILIILSSLSGCTGLLYIKHNRFATANDLINFSSFDKECRKQDGSKPYKNGVYPSRICVSYQRYKCRIEITCMGDKECERDAQNWWIPSWVNSKTKEPVKDKVFSTKKHCQSEANKCNNAAQKDNRCLKSKK